MYLYRKYDYSNQEYSEEKIKELNTSFFQYGRDEHHVYIATYPGGSINDTFPVSWKDERIFVTKLKNSDSSSFTLLCQVFAKDSNNVYVFGKAKRNFDSKSFELIYTNKSKTDVWSRDCNHLYRWGDKVKNIDGESFSQLNDHWGKDKNFVYSFLTRKVYKSVDVNSFQVLEGYEAQDKDYRYEIVLNENKGVGINENDFFCAHPDILKLVKKRRKRMDSTAQKR